jgi:hypothetical protein
MATHNPENKFTDMLSPTTVLQSAFTSKASYQDAELAKRQVTTGMKISNGASTATSHQKPTNLPSTLQTTTLEEQVTVIPEITLSMYGAQGNTYQLSLRPVTVDAKANAKDHARGIGQPFLSVEKGVRGENWQDLATVDANEGRGLGDGC